MSGGSRHCVEMANSRRAMVICGCGVVAWSLWADTRLLCMAGHGVLYAGAAPQNGLMTTLAMAALLTFGNPHVYLDTMVLIGMVSLQFEDIDKIAFTVGAATASFMFFIVLGYGAAALSSIMQSQNAWRILDASVAVVMLVLTFGMAQWQASL